MVNSYRYSDGFNAFTYNQTGFRIEEEPEEEEAKQGTEEVRTRKKNSQDTLFLAKVGRI